MSLVITGNLTAFQQFLNFQLNTRVQWMVWTLYVWVRILYSMRSVILIFEPVKRV